MAPLEIACVATLLLLGSVLANHNDLDIVSIYDSNLYYDVRNIGYSTALVNDTYTSGAIELPTSPHSSADHPAQRQPMAAALSKR